MITAHPFGHLPDGTPVTRYRLTGGSGAYTDILDYGGTVQSIVVPDKTGQPTDVVLGYDDIGGYVAGDCFFGATVGRHANRIGGAVFTLEGKTYRVAKNDGENHLHGGPVGFDKRMFRGEIAGDALRLHLISADMDQGFPGELRLTVTFTFSSNNALTIHYEAETDKTTLVNLTNHSYFDLSGGKDPMGQLLSIDAVQFCDNDEHTLPTGIFLDVAGTAFDFRQEKPLGRDLQSGETQLLFCGGYDHNFILKNGGKLEPVAVLRSPDTGIAMTTATDLPGIQLYSGNFIKGTGKGERVYKPNDAVCLETQFFPNALHIPGAAQPVLQPGEKFDHTTVYQFYTDRG